MSQRLSHEKYAEANANKQSETDILLIKLDFGAISTFFHSFHFFLFCEKFKEDIKN